MKLTVLQENLNQAVSACCRIISSKASLAILDNLLLIAEKNTFSLSATNLETSLVIQVPAKIETEGRICLPAKNLQELVSSLIVAPITIESEKEKALISCGKSRIELKGMTASEFPAVPELDKEVKGWKIPFDQFVAATSQVVFAASTDQARPVLSGVLVNIQKNGLELVATDGYRLSRKYLTAGFDKEAVFIIPARALSEVARIGQDTKEIEFFLDKKGNQVIFLVKNVRLVSRLIDGQFPPFSKVIPSSYQTTVSLDREELIASLKTAAVFAKESANIVKLKVKSQKLKISANSATIGQEESEIEAKIEGEDTEIAFNYRFVLEFLTNLEAGQIRLKLGGGLSPALFEVPGDKDFLHVIMPVRVQSG